MKNRTIKIIFVLVLTLCSAKLIQGKEWRGIVPLKSTRADVERLLGKPNAGGRYEFENERAYIDYAKGCKESKDCVCLVPKDTVTSIFVTLESDLKLSELKIDRTRYKKSRSGHLPNIVNFVNHEEGITYTVDEDDDEVMHITFLPTRSDCQNLVNRARTDKRRSLRRRGDAAPALDTNTLRPYSLPFRTFSLKHPKSNVQLVL